MGTTIELAAEDGFVFPAYMAPPVGQAKGAIVVLQEIFGVNSHIRAVTDGFAEQGYLAVAPSTFHRVKAGVELGYAPADVSAGAALKAAVEALPEAGVLQDIDATIRHVAQAGKVGLVGFCWGGLLTWRAACELANLSAAVCYYGGGMTVSPESGRHPRCPVLAHFGKRDHAIPIEGVHAFQLAQPGVSVQTYDAGHGFNCDQRAAFDAAAAALARERSLAFFATHLS